MTDDFRLVMSQGPQPGQTFPLDKDSLTLGRDPGNDIVINDPQVSRQHARITRQGGLMVIEDLGSTNGTFVNGMRLTGPHTLVSGDVIGLGDAVTLTYHGASVAVTRTIVGQPAAAPPPPSYAPPPPIEEEKSKTGLWVGCGCLVLILACIVAALFVWYAPASFWQALIDLGIPVPAWPF